MERHSGEGGAPSVLNPLALTYHFGRATSTPDRSRTLDIAGRRPQPAVENNVAERDGADNSISDASFEDGRGVYSMKRDGADTIIPEASATTGLEEASRVYSKKFFKTCPQWRKPWHFFPEKTKTLLGGSIQKK